MSMILLEPANTILYGSVEDQAADHLINGVLGNYAPIQSELAENATLQEQQSTGCCKCRWMPKEPLCEDGEDLSETLLILTPLLVLVGLGLLGVLLGSMGMDIHWNSRGTFYVAATWSVLILY